MRRSRRSVLSDWRWPRSGCRLSGVVLYQLPGRTREYGGRPEPMSCIPQAICMLISCVSRGAADRPQIGANDVAAVCLLAVQAPGACGFEVVFAAKLQALASEARRSADPNLAGASWQLCSVRWRPVGGGGPALIVTSPGVRVWGGCADESCDRMAPQRNSADAEWLCPSLDDL